MPSAVAVAEAPSGRIIAANPRMRAMWRRPVELPTSTAEYERLPVLRLDGTPLTPDEHPLGRAILRGETVVGDHLIVAEDGARLTVRVCSAPVRDAGERIVAGVLTFHDVTERARIEEALRESEERFRRLVQDVEEYGIFMLDPAGRVATWNAGAARITGFCSEEVIGRHYSLFFPQEDTLLGKPEPPLRVAAERGRYEEEGWRIRKDGSRFWASVVLTGIREPDGRLRGFAKVLRDATERKLVQDALAEASRRTVGILESISDAFCAIDREGRFTYVNPEAERLLEARRADLLGRTLEDVLPVGFDTPLLKELARALVSREHHELEEYAPRLGRWLEVRSYPSDIGTSLYFRDVTERHAAERAQRFLAESGRRLAESLDYAATLDTVAAVAVPDYADCCVALAIEDGAHRVAVAHPDPAQRALARERLERSAMPAQARMGLARVLRTGEADVIPEVTEATYRDLAADYAPELIECLRGLAPVSLMAVPLRARGRTLGVMGFISTSPARRYRASDVPLGEEVGRRAALALDNARLYREAQDAIRAREDMVSIASHDLRSPITALKLRVQKMSMQARRAAPPATALADELRMLEAQIDRLTTLVDFFLDVSRIAAGTLQLDLVDVDAAEVLREVAARHAEDAARAGSTVRVEAPEHLVGRWDRMRLDQLVHNLLSNAIKYGEGKPIELTLEGSDGTARLRVRDQGIGMNPAELDHVFERFRRAGDPRARGGFGLGLWIVRRVVDAFGGEVAVDSAPGRGTTFHVDLPRVSSTARAA